MTHHMWDERYAEPGFAYGDEPNDFLRAMAPRLPVGRTLCLAEGQGRNAVFLAGLGHKVTMVDWSVRGLERATMLAATRGVQVTTVQADLADYVIAPATWQCIVAIFAHFPPALRAAIHCAAANGLVPGGMFVLEAYTPDQPALGTGGPRDPDMLMTTDGLRGECRGLLFEYLAEQRRPVVEGPYHTGEAAVVQMLAVKPATD
jgi:hypothetical protein